MKEISGRAINPNPMLERIDRMMSAAGWHPDDVRVDEVDGLIRLTHLPSGKIRQWDKSRDKYPDRDLGVAP